MGAMTLPLHCTFSDQPENRFIVLELDGKFFIGIIEGFILSVLYIRHSSHKKNSKHIPTNTNPFRYSFVPRTIIEWNPLPALDVECTSPESFKTQLAWVKWD